MVRVKCFAQEHNKMTQPGLEPRPLDPDLSTQTSQPRPLNPESSTQTIGLTHL